MKNIINVQMNKDINRLNECVRNSSDVKSLNNIINYIAELEEEQRVLIQGNDDIEEELEELQQENENLQSKLDKIEEAYNRLLKIVPRGSDEMLDAYYQGMDNVILKENPND